MTDDANTKRGRSWGNHGLPHAEKTGRYQSPDYFTRRESSASRQDLLESVEPRTLDEVGLDG